MLRERLAALAAEGRAPAPGSYRPPVRLRDRATWQEVTAATRRYWIERGEGYLDYDWPELGADLYEEYARTGERTRFEAAYHKRRQVIGTLLLAEGFEAGGRFLPGLLCGLGRVCGEPTWVLPAHAEGPAAEPGSPGRWTIDIFSAETGNMLAWLAYVLAGAPGFEGTALQARVRWLVRERVLDPYLERSDLWWMGSGGAPLGNWTTWCTSNCLGALLLMESDPVRLRRGVEKACASLDRFLEVYGEDGGCDEGPLYWNFAAGCVLDSLEMLHEATGGALDLFGREEVKKLGTYVRKVHVHDLRFVNFADCPPEVPVDAALVYRYGRRIGDEAMQALGIHLHHALERQDPENTIRLKAYRALAALADEPALSGPAPPLCAPRRSYLPKLEVLVVREDDRPGVGFLMAVKGGHNEEGHNHNDVGNVLVYLDGRPVLVDAGLKQYSRESFSERRYEIWAMQSAYHNVPVVNGYLQEHGRARGARAARLLAAPETVGLGMDIAAAYPEAARLDSWQRECALGGAPAEVRIRDAFRFGQAANRFELRFLTAGRPVALAGGVLVPAGERSVRLAARPAPAMTTLHELRLRDPYLVHAWGPCLYQVRMTFEGVARSGEVVTVVRAVHSAAQEASTGAPSLHVEEVA